MAKKHTGFFSSFVSVIILSIPSVMLYAYDLPFLMLIYNGAILFSIMKGFSNRLWISEVDTALWARKWAFLHPATKKNKYRAIN